MPTGLSLLETMLLGQVGGAVVGKMFGGNDSAPPAPAVIKPTAMPDPLAEQAKGRRKASILASQQMGAASTVLTSDKLGG